MSACPACRQGRCEDCQSLGLACGCCNLYAEAGDEE